MTAQVPEILLHRGRRLDLCAQPLFPWLRRLRGRRRRTFAPPSTACWRGYVGTWSIVEGRLCLVALEGLLKVPGGDGFEVREVTLETAFPWLDGPLQATWVDEDLRCPEGRLIDYAHHGYASRYERDRILRIAGGLLVDEFLRFNPPAPLVYRIAPDGTRTCVDDAGRAPHAIADPFPPDEEPVAHRYFGRPPVEEEGGAQAGGGYAIAGLTRFGYPKADERDGG